QYTAWPERPRVVGNTRSGERVDAGDRRPCRCAGVEAEGLKERNRSHLRDRERRRIWRECRAERLLRWSLSADDRQTVLGDLQEEFGAIEPTHGMVAARRWYWWQVTSSI